MRDGRPLRFLGTTLAGWTLLRAFALWPSAEPLREAARHLGIGRAAAAMPAAAVAPLPVPTPTPPARMIHGSVASRRAATTGLPSRGAAASGSVAPSIDAQATPRHTATEATVPPFVPPSFVPPPPQAGQRRFAASAWLIARGGAERGLLGGQLGASQAGVRATYAIDTRRRLALAGRLATPLGGRGREAAIGLDWQPTTAPVHLIAERRWFPDGGRGGPSLSVVGGIGPTAVAAGFVVEGYGQAGGIARGRLDGFADGLVRIAHPLARLRQATVDIGIGAWGGAQRGASRLDIGPSVAFTLPVAGKAIRLGIDWRDRVVGDARPGSGPAFSVGSDF